MVFFGDKSKKKKKRSWQQLSFAKTATKAEILAREQSTSHRVARVLSGTTAVVLATFLVGFGSQEVAENPWGGWIAAAGVILLINFAFQGVLRAYHPRVRRSVKRFQQLLILITVFLLIAKVMLPHAPAADGGISPFLVPMPVLAILLALIYTGPVAICAVAATAAMVGLMYEYTPHGDVSDCLLLSISLFIGSLVAIAGVSKIRNRTRLVVVGTACGAVQFAAIAFLKVWLEGVPQFQSMESVLAFLADPGWGFLNGLCSGILVTSALPFVERLFDVTTDIRLIELADQNHPLLRQFSLLAPGSFMHSLMVGQLAEEAAQSIGANDLLARVGAYYHDIGKMLKPNYFVENTGDGPNAHDRLSPGMSRLIIISHVKDGIRIAEEEGLPRPIIDMIPMHHGTSVVEYFFHKKRQQEEEQGLDEESGEEAFQYPGPKPTFREAGILMLADTTEAISRVLSDPTPTRLRQVVRDVIQKKMVTGQLDECELTMRDLKGIEDAFVRVLASIHHGRIRYPGDDGEGAAANGKEKDAKESGAKEQAQKESSSKEASNKEAGKEARDKDAASKSAAATKDTNGKPENAKHAGKPTHGKQTPGKQGDGKQVDSKQSSAKHGNGKQGHAKQGNGTQGSGKPAAVGEPRGKDSTKKEPSARDRNGSKEKSPSPEDRPAAKRSKSADPATSERKKPAEPKNPGPTQKPAVPQKPVDPKKNGGRGQSSTTATAPTPSKSVQVTNRQNRLPIEPGLVRSLVLHALEAEESFGRVEVVFVDDDKIADLHERFLGVAGATDVITFPAENGDVADAQGLLGEIVVSTDTAVRQAPEFSGDPLHESYLYVVHGVLHLLGYNDQNPSDHARMDARQNELLESWKKSRNGTEASS